MIGKGKKSLWKLEYEDTFYKVYDWNNKLSGYFFPHYGQIKTEGEEDDAIEQLNRDRAELTDGTLVVPMLKLELLDSEGAIAIEKVVSSLQSSKDRASKWNDWLGRNASALSIYGVGVHTAREDRNMLSIALAIHGKMTLGDKNIKEFLTPLLDRLHSEGLL